MTRCWQCPECGYQIRRAVTLPVACPCGVTDSIGAGINKCESRGLGDTVAKITSAVGIAPCVGCVQRQATLNTLFPYKNE